MGDGEVEWLHPKWDRAGWGLCQPPCASLEMPLQVSWCRGRFTPSQRECGRQGGGYSLVMPSVMMSVILQQDESMRMLSWSTTSTWGQVSTP